LGTRQDLGETIPKKQANKLERIPQWVGKVDLLKNRWKMKLAQKELKINHQEKNLQKKPRMKEMPTAKSKRATSSVSNRV